MDSALSLLEAVETRLKGYAPLTDLVGQRIYGAIPANPTYPYVLITCTSEPFDDDDGDDMEHRLRVQGFVRENKPARPLAIRKAVFDALNRKEDLLSPEEGTVVLIDQVMADCFPEPDGRTYQSIIEFKVLMN